MSLYTKNGRPLQVSGDKVYSASGKIVGRINGAKVHGTNGRYVGTIVEGRLVYRSSDSASVAGPFTTANLAGFAQARQAGAAMWGEEPDIPE